MMIDLRNKRTYWKGVFIGLVQAVVGYAYALINFVGVILRIVSSTSGTAEDIFTVLIFAISVAFGVWFGINGLKRISLQQHFLRCADEITNDPCPSIERLAAVMGVSLETAIKKLTQMIVKGYFYRAHIDYKNMCLVLENDNKQPDSRNGSPNQNDAIIG